MKAFGRPIKGCNLTVRSGGINYYDRKRTATEIMVEQEQRRAIEEQMSWARRAEEEIRNRGRQG